MMGLHVSQPPLFSYRLNLEHRVRADHPLRAIQEQIDFTFVRAAVAAKYGHNGHESVDPAILLKLLFLLFYDNVASERELLQILPERLDYLWFLGYELDEAVPHHSVLSKARRRWGRAVFEEFFVRTVGQCVAAGLVAGDKVHLDASLVDANAANKSVVTLPAEWVAQLKRTFAEQEPKLAEPDVSPVTHGPGAAPVAPASPGAPRAPAKTNDTLVSRTDPSTAVVRGGGRGARARFKTHRAVDDTHGVITATETTAGDVDEATRLLALVVAHEQHTQQPAQTVVADSKYGTVENYRVGQLRGLRTHMADLHTKQQGTGRQVGIYREDQFRYDARRDAYRCPAGQWLPRHHWHAGRKLWEYRAAPGVCAACPQHAACTRAKAGRSVRRHWQPELVERGRAQAASAAARRDRHRRQQVMEGSFADAANNHGFKRARWRGAWRQTIQDNLIAGVQNVRILLRGRRDAVASGAQALRGASAPLMMPRQGTSRRRIFRNNSPTACGLPKAMFGWN